MRVRRPLSFDPYHDNPIYHFADLVNQSGDVSALCYKRPRKINLEITKWTIVESDVTCKKCLCLIKHTEAVEVTA